MRASAALLPDADDIFDAIFIDTIIIACHQDTCFFYDYAAAATPIRHVITLMSISLRHYDYCLPLHMSFIDIDITILLMPLMLMPLR